MSTTEESQEVAKVPTTTSVDLESPTAIGSEASTFTDDGRPIALRPHAESSAQTNLNQPEPQKVTQDSGCDPLASPHFCHAPGYPVPEAESVPESKMTTGKNPTLKEERSDVGEPSPGVEAPYEYEEDEEDLTQVDEERDDSDDGRGPRDHVTAWPKGKPGTKGGGGVRK